MWRYLCPKILTTDFEPIPETYWAVNVDYLADEHYIELGYKMRASVKLDFMQPRAAPVAVSREALLINRSCSVSNLDLVGCLGASGICRSPVCPDTKLFTTSAGPGPSKESYRDNGIFIWPPAGGIVDVPEDVEPMEPARDRVEFNEDDFLDDVMSHVNFD